jgi:hypothetical protein
MHYWAETLILFKVIEKEITSHPIVSPKFVSIMQFVEAYVFFNQIKV